MNITGLIVALAIGAVAGFLAGKIVKGHGFGIVGNIVVGVLGAFVSGMLFGNLHILGSPILNQIAGGTLGAILLLLLLGVFKK